MDKKLNLKGEAKENLVGYFSQTTVHGFRYIVQGRNIFERLIWILFLDLVKGRYLEHFVMYL